MPRGLPREFLLKGSMKSEEDIQAWNLIAERYAQVVESSGDRCMPEVGERFWELLGDVNGKRILDLGCGQGRLVYELSSRGADVVGIDGSEELVQRGRKLYPGLSFMVYDLVKGLPELGGSFDIVVSKMALMDIPEIAELFQSIANVLKPGGVFVFTLPHPCFFMQKSHQDGDGQWFKKHTGYLDLETRRIETFGGHNHYHRPLSYYVRNLSSAGLLLYELYEPGHKSSSGKVDPAFLVKFPVFMLMGARRCVN